MGVAGLENRIGRQRAELTVLAIASNEIAQRGLDAMLGDLPEVGHAQVVGAVDEAVRLRKELSVDAFLLPSECIGEAEVAGLFARDGEGAERVLIVLQCTDDEELDLAMSVRSHGFLSREELTTQSLRQALNRVVAGDVPMPMAIANKLLERAREARSGKVSAGLTAREQQVLELLVEGMSNKQIARRLKISQHGAKRLVANLLAKLNCPNRTVAVVIALQNGMVDR